MNKYFKSWFHSTEKKKRTVVYEAETEDGTETSMDSRRKLSISRSGRLKQSNKKRHSLSMELYGENCQPVEKPKSVEYHVNVPVKTEAKSEPVERRRSAEAKLGDSKERPSLPNCLVPANVDNRRPSADTKVLETEIDNAFEVIDKT